MLSQIEGIDQGTSLRKHWINHRSEEKFRKVHGTDQNATSLEPKWRNKGQGWRTISNKNINRSTSVVVEKGVLKDPLLLL